jgi:hypothetical protein
MGRAAAFWDRCLWWLEELLFIEHPPGIKR